VIVQALDSVALGFGLAQPRQQQAREDADDGNHHQQFNQRKGAFLLHGTGYL